jgi:HTH-type transcriptional regulator/antitoxin HigA
VEKLVREKSLPDFKLDDFQGAIPDLLNYSQKEEDVAKIPTFLNDLGVNFVIVPQLKNTYLDGAAFYFNNNPVIALTLRYDRIDNFWFTLMHELGHIVSGHQDTYLDNLENLDATSEEVEANNFAHQWLINEESFNSFITEKKPKFTGKAIANFALQQNRHPGIILSRLHHEELVPHRKLRKFLVKVEPFLSPWIDC